METSPWAPKRSQVRPPGHIHKETTSSIFQIHNVVKPTSLDSIWHSSKCRYSVVDLNLRCFDTTITGWWFGTLILFFHILGFFHYPNWRTPSFFRGVGWNHQPDIIWSLWSSHWIFGFCTHPIRINKIQYPWRIHGAGIYANIKGIYWWDPWHTIYSSTVRIRHGRRIDFIPPCVEARSLSRETKMMETPGDRNESRGRSRRRVRLVVSLTEIRGLVPVKRRQWQFSQRLTDSKNTMR